ncbi:glycosyl transferase [Azospirillum sp. YIM B02556]|uniref:Glycosyl transferase n=2 Tax=Azospirillum endophyticum TaxID=2800326 RepID=A0ABS1FF15_9PROT|nr:glycosyl transferase [Azospirillum endophyticum]MBK1842030.1 glycosyl transferase [Azospirillum endophyticum]
MPADLPADAYGRQMIEALRAAGVGITLHALPGPHPQVDASAILAADVALTRLPDGAPVLLDGNALPNLAAGLAADSRRLHFTALVEHLTWTEPGRPADQAAVQRSLEQGALALMRRVVVPDAATAAAVRDLGVQADRIVHAAADTSGVAVLLANL